MASIQKRYLKDGKTPRWDAYWRDATGKQHKKTFRRRKDADRYLTKVKKDVQDGTFRDIRPTPMEEVFDAWLENELEVRLKLGDRMKPSTAGTYRNMVEKHFQPAFGAVRSDRLTPSVVAKWRRKMADRVAAGDMAKKTYNNLHALLGQILAWAREPAQRYLRHDPMEGVERMQVTRAERREAEAEFLEADEIVALLEAAAASPEESAVAHLGLFAGLRRGEIFGLRWADIEPAEDGPGGRVHVRQAISGGEVTSPKTAYSQRTVDVPQDVLDALASHREATADDASGWVFPSAVALSDRRLADALLCAVEDDDAAFDAAERAFIHSLAGCEKLPAAERERAEHLYQRELGTPLDPDNWYSRAWVPLRKRAGLPKGVGLHSLRHTFASLLIDQGENVKYISRQLGHSSTSFTLDRYGHLFQETGDRAMGRLQKTIRKAKARRFEVVAGGRE